jgi:hypothetical protein
MSSCVNTEFPPENSVGFVSGVFKFHGTSCRYYNESNNKNYIN